MSDSIVTSVFVYGTLKRGQCRETRWPVQPLRIQTAFVSGTLFSRHDYPALRQGTDRVKGELWTFLPDQMSIVLARLDAIEGTNGNSPDDLYHRHVIDALIDDCEESIPAYGYFYVCDPLTDGFQRMTENDSGHVAWPAA